MAAHADLKDDPGRQRIVRRGADEQGREEPPAIAGGHRESARSWRGPLPDPGRRGLGAAPGPAVGDGAPGFRKALRETRATARDRRCRPRKTGNVPNKLPGSPQVQGRGHPQNIRTAGTGYRAEAASEFLPEARGAKYDKAAARPDSVMISIPDMSIGLRISLSLPGQAKPSGRNRGQFTAGHSDF